MSYTLEDFKEEAKNYAINVCAPLGKAYLDSGKIPITEFSQVMKQMAEYYKAFPCDEVIASGYTVTLALWMIIKQRELRILDLRDMGRELVNISERFPCNEYIDGWAKMGITAYVWDSRREDWMNDF